MNLTFKKIKDDKKVKNHYLVSYKTRDGKVVEADFYTKYNDKDFIPEKYITYSKIDLNFWDNELFDTNKAALKAYYISEEKQKVANAIGDDLYSQLKKYNVSYEKTQKESDNLVFNLLCHAAILIAAGDFKYNLNFKIKLNIKERNFTSAKIANLIITFDTKNDIDTIIDTEERMNKNEWFSFDAIYNGRIKLKITQPNGKDIIIDFVDRYEILDNNNLVVKVSALNETFTGYYAFTSLEVENEYNVNSEII